MIIVSQEKMMVYNFENIEAIGIGNPLENNEGKFPILIDTTSDNQYPIAEYKTKERAKEVLQEIIKTYQVLETIKSQPDLKIQKEILEKTNADIFVYKMPLE
jgi:hypothetical protein